MHFQVALSPIAGCFLLQMCHIPEIMKFLLQLVTTLGNRHRRISPHNYLRMTVVQAPVG